MIADISANRVELLALLNGYSVERVVSDYGIDLVLFTYSPGGFIENGSVLIQLKSTDSTAVRAMQAEWSLSVSTADLSYWMKEPNVVILVYYHTGTDAARWLYVQRDLKTATWKPGQHTKTVKFPKRQALRAQTFRDFATFKAKVVAEAGSVITHE